MTDFIISTVDSATPPPADTTVPTLSSLLVTAGQTSANWTVTSDESNGTVFAAVRLRASTALSRADIENGTGDALFTSSDATMMADGSNGSAFVGLTAGTDYAVDAFARDAAGNESTVISRDFSTAAAGAASVSIAELHRSNEQVAPEVAMFEARVTGFDVSEDLNLDNYDPASHRIFYKWTVTLQGQSYVARPATKLVNIPSVWNDTNTRYGKRMAHCFTAPGTYTITCTARDEIGTVASATFTHTVADPDVVFAGNRTILVDPALQADGNYPGAQVVANISAAISASDGVSGTARIMLRRGQVFTDQDLLGWSGADNYYFAAYGTGADPICRVASDNWMSPDFGFGGDFITYGIRFEGPWDSINETGGEYKAINTRSGSGTKYILAVDCEFDGWDMAIVPAGETGNNVNAQHGIHVYNTSITNWKFYGILFTSAPAGFSSLTAVDAYCDPNANSGGPKNNPYNNHGPFRFAEPGVVCIDLVNMFSRVGWSSSVSGIPGYSTMPADQPCIRFNTTGRAGKWMSVTRSVWEGGNDLITYAGGGNFNQNFLANIVIDMNIMIATAATSNFINLATTGWTARNNVFIKSNLPRAAGQWRGIVRPDTGGNSIMDPSAPTLFYNNSIINLMDDTNLEGRDLPVTDMAVAGAIATNFQSANNVHYAPNATGYGDSGLNLTLTAITTPGGTLPPRYLGPKFQATSTSGNQALQPIDSSYATPPGDIDLPVLGVGSSAIGAAAGNLVAINDFNGDVRVGAADRGAIQT